MDLLNFFPELVFLRIGTLYIEWGSFTFVQVEMKKLFHINLQIQTLNEYITFIQN
jgi:hypothetical protein